VLIKILSLLISPRNFFLGNKASKQQGRKGACFGSTNSELHESKRREKLADACFSKPKEYRGKD
jgi:hypothetical protein